MNEWVVWGNGNEYSCLDIVRLSTEHIKSMAFNDGLLFGLFAGFIMGVIITILIKKTYNKQARKNND